MPAPRCTFLVEQDPEVQVGPDLHVQLVTIWSATEVPDQVVLWLASNSRVVGPGGQGQRYKIVDRGTMQHPVHLALVHWVDVEWTIDSGD